MTRKRTAIIIGAGVGGLALANILAKAGMKVHVYEKNSAPGGRMGKLVKDGFTFDTGPSWYLMKDVFEHYFGLFDKTTRDYYELIKLDPSYKVFFDSDDPLTIRPKSAQTTRAFESIEPGAGDRLQAYLRSGERNYKLALEYFLYNSFKDPFALMQPKLLRHLPALVPLIGMSLHSYVKRYFKQPRLQQIVEYPSVFLGASPYNAPALYQLMSYLDFKEGVFYPKHRGMHAVTEALYSLGKELGVRYSFNAPVDKIVVKHGSARGVKVRGNYHEADIVISNADLHFTETKLLSESARSYPKPYWQKRTAGPSALLMYLGIKGKLPELEHHNLLLVSSWKRNFDDIYKRKTWPDKASMYVSKTTQTDRATAPKGHENLFVLVPLPAGTASSKKSVNAAVDHYLQQIEAALGIPNLRSRIVTKEVRTPEYFGSTFNAWQNTALGMSHTLRQSAFMRPSVKSKKVANLYYVGAGAQPGIGVPMCIISAQLVYKDLVQDRSVSAPKSIVEIPS